MKKAKSTKQTKTAATTSSAKTSSARKKAKSKLITKSKISMSPIHDTSGGEMPNPGSKTKPSRKDVRFGFR